jgi:hypothetical protein
MVRIEWPSGLVQELRDLPADQILSVTEPFRLEVMGPGQFCLRGWRGQVSTVEASADLRTWNAIATVTNLTCTAKRHYVPGFGVPCMATHPGFVSSGVSRPRETPLEAAGLLNATPLALDEFGNGHASPTGAQDTPLECTALGVRPMGEPCTIHPTAPTPIHGHRS